MAGRAAQTFKKRQKEQQRKEKQLEKMANRLSRKGASQTSTEEPVEGAEGGLEIETDVTEASPNGPAA